MTHVDLAVADYFEPSCLYDAELHRDAQADADAAHLSVNVHSQTAAAAAHLPLYRDLAVFVSHFHLHTSVAVVDFQKLSHHHHVVVAAAVAVAAS